MLARNLIPILVALITPLSTAASETSTPQDIEMTSRQEGLETRQAPREYNLQIAYEGRSFFDGWEFFNKPDPSWGCKLYRA